MGSKNIDAIIKSLQKIADKDGGKGFCSSQTKTLYSAIENLQKYKVLVD